MTEAVSPSGRLLVWLLLLYGAASLLHFAHNAEYLADYPNLPAWLSRSQVYGVWLCITALGAVGYFVYRKVHEFGGLVLMGVYAALGFDGLLHYGRAPMAEHTAGMNLSIGFEVVAAVLLFCAILLLAANHFRQPRRVNNSDA
jgi:hypothetical protein